MSVSVVFIIIKQLWLNIKYGKLFTDEELKGYCKGKWAEKFIEETT